MSWLTDIWCELTHGGGRILRDPSGRINWQCEKCGRWSDPVPAEDEHAVTRSAMAERTCPPCDHRCRQGRDCPARR